MKKTILSAAILASTLTSGLSYATDPLAEKYFSTNSNPVLTPQEKAAIQLHKDWSAGSQTGMKPVAGPNGAAYFLYGAQQPSIVCAVLQVCDVALQAGEMVNSIHLGDTARWQVEPAITGSGSAEVQHLIIKPLDVGLTTSLVVTTDRRTYHLRLRSHRTEYMPSVAFTYPEDALAKWKTIQRRERQTIERGTIPATGEYLGNLSFNYDVTGAADWKPVRVYNDGKKTIIEMPKEFHHRTEAPVLMAVRRANGLFKKNEHVTVNYRVQGERYIVDTVFEKAIMVAGVGSTKKQVTITRKD